MLGVPLLGLNFSPYILSSLDKVRHIVAEACLVILQLNDQAAWKHASPEICTTLLIPTYAVGRNKPAGSTELMRSRPADGAQTDADTSDIR